VTELTAGEVAHRWPQILPEGRGVLFTSTTNFNFEAASIEVLSMKTHRRKTLVRGGTFGRYLPSGHLVYVHDGKLFAVAFDLDALEVRGTPVPAVEQVAYNATLIGSAQFDFSGAGSGPGMLLYRSGKAADSVTVQWLDSAGRMQPLLAKPGNYARPRHRQTANVWRGNSRDRARYGSTSCSGIP
jgi:serine/threonine-protein kinase